MYTMSRIQMTLECLDMRIMVADHQSKVRFALRTLLARRPGLEVVGEADTVEGLLAGVSAAQPDLLLLHWRLDEEMPGLLSTLKRVCPGLRVIVLDRRELSRGDVRGCRRIDEPRLCERMRGVVCGERWILIPLRPDPIRGALRGERWIVGPDRLDPIRGVLRGCRRIVAW